MQPFAVEVNVSLRRPYVGVGEDRLKLLEISPPLSAHILPKVVHIP